MSKLPKWIRITWLPTWRSPDEGVLELLDDGAVDLVAEVLQGAVVRLQHHGRLVVGQLPLRLRVNPAILVVYKRPWWLLMLVVVHLGWFDSYLGYLTILFGNYVATCVVKVAAQHLANLPKQKSAKTRCRTNMVTQWSSLRQNKSTQLVEMIKRFVTI